MRVLNPLREEQLRLGWLAVLVNLVHRATHTQDAHPDAELSLLTQYSERQVPLSEVAQALEAVEQRIQAWSQQAGFERGPLGGVQPGRRDQTVRMLCTYGCYDERRQQLTEQGALLQHVRPDVLEPSGNPLRWEGAAWWLGFTTLIQSAGDVLLPLLRDWIGAADARDSIQPLEGLIARLSTLLSGLAERAVDSTLAQSLREQAARKDQKDAAKRLVYPYLEPLVELELLRPVRLGQRKGYALTEDGERLVCALQQDTRTADALLEQGLSRLALRVRCPDAVPRAATLGDLRAALASLPPSLARGSGQEVSQRTLASYMQARLWDQEPPGWIDMPRLTLLVQLVTQRSQARLSFKRGLSLEEPNIIWESVLLEDQALWQEEVYATPTPSSLDAGLRLPVSGEELSAHGLGDLCGTSTAAHEDSARLAQVAVEESAVEEAAIEESAVEEAAIEESAEVSHGTTAAPVHPPEAESTGTPSRIPESVADEARPTQSSYPSPTAAQPQGHTQSAQWPFCSDVPASHKLWLQAIEELLSADHDRAVGLHPWRGLIGSLRHLHLLLQMPKTKLDPKRKKEGSTFPPALVLLDEVCKSLDEKKAQVLDEEKAQVSAVSRLILRRVVDVWCDVDKVSVDQLEAVLQDALDHHTQLTTACFAPVKEFLDAGANQPEAIDWNRWTHIQTLTRSLLLDALELGMLDKSDLGMLDKSELGMLDKSDLGILTQAPTKGAEGNKIVGHWRGLLESLAAETPIEFELEATLKTPISHSSENKLERCLSEKVKVSVNVNSDPTASDVLETPNPDGLTDLQKLPEDFPKAPALELTGTVRAYTHAQARRLVEKYVPRLFSEDGSRPCPLEIKSLLPESTCPPDPAADKRVTLPTSFAQPSSPQAAGKTPPMSLTYRPHFADRVKFAQHLLSSLPPHAAGQSHPLAELSRIWTAWEQLVSGGEDSKDRAIRVAVPVLTLLHLAHTGRQLLRDTLYALSTVLMGQPAGTSPPCWQGEWLGSDGPKKLTIQRKLAPPLQRSWLVSERITLNPFYSPERIAESIHHLLTNRASVKEVQDCISPYFPRVSDRLTLFFELLGYDVRNTKDLAPKQEKDSKRLKNLEGLKARFSALLWFCYELRNQFAHEAHAFHEEELPRLKEYADSLRLLTQALVGCVERYQHQKEGLRPEVLWALLGERYHKVCTYPLDNLAPLLDDSLLVPHLNHP